MVNSGAKNSLNKELKTLGKHGLIYGGAEILSRLIGFLMIPVYTHFLSTSDYGVMELVGLTGETIGIVLGLGIADAIYRFYHDKKEMESTDLVISTASIGVCVLSFLVLVLISLQSNYIASIVLEGRHQGVYILLALATLWFNQQVHLVYTYLRVKEKSSLYSAISIARLVMGLSLNILFVVILKKGVLGVFISNLISAVFFSLVCFPVMMRKVGLHFSVGLAKRMLRFSMPVVPSNLASLIVNASDRYFIKVFLSMSDAGIYSLGYKLGNVVFYLVRIPFMQIWSPRSYAIYYGGGSPEIFAKVATYFTGLMIFVGLGISVFVNDIIKLISPQDYWLAARYTPAVVLCYIVYALDNHVGFGIMIAKKTEYWTIINLIMGGLNIGLNFLLIPRWGMWGAVLATLFSLVFKISALYSIGRRYFSIPFEWGRMAIMLGIAVIIYLVRLSLDPGGMILALCLDAVLALAFPVILWVAGVINQEERKSAVSLRKSITRKALSFLKM